jgi:hypothetical protein
VEQTGTGGETMRGIAALATFAALLSAPAYMEQGHLFPTPQGTTAADFTVTFKLNISSHHGTLHYGCTSENQPQRKLTDSRIKR